MVEDGKLKPGESVTKRFDYYDGAFDEAKYYIVGTVGEWSLQPRIGLFCDQFGGQSYTVDEFSKMRLYNLVRKKGARRREKRWNDFHCDYQLDCRIGDTGACIYINRR